MLYFIQTECGSNGFVEARQRPGIERLIQARFGGLFGCRECATLSEADPAYCEVPDYRVDDDGTVWSREPYKLENEIL